MGVDGGDPLGGDRQRNIFPLPPISDDFKSGAQTSGWGSVVNQGINALNVLAGCSNSAFSKKKPTRVQRRVLQHISDSFNDVATIVDDDPGRSALEDLCSSSRLYHVDRSDVVSYARELVSWPKVESSPIPLGDCLPAADREWLATWRKHMLKPEDSDGSAQLPKKPYMDPILKNKQVEYANFVHELHQRHMIRFKLDTSDAGTLGVFCVRKKNGSQRLIFDTRILNDKFHEPPSTDLPSADAFTRLELPDNKPFFIGSGDLANAFYTLSVPDELGQMFTLPALKADRCGLDEIDGVKLRPGTMVCPYLVVLPMGWSWALHLCQSVLLHSIRESGISDNWIISDKGSPVRLENHDDIACGGYVDNFVVIGESPSAVDAGLAKISERLRSLGLTVHEEESASRQATFVGLHFNGDTGFIGLKPQRILKLQKAIRELLHRNFASGDLLQLILGHVTWAMMCRREGLSILKTCYAFVHHNMSKPCRLWPSVRFELDTIASLLPLFRSRVNVGWSKDVCASDSSPFGYGICHRQGQGDIIQSIGSQCERWRFRFEDAVDARRHAAKSVGLDELQKGSQHFGDSNGYLGEHIQSVIGGHGFDEVPISFLDPGEWNVVWSSPWKHSSNILHTEALALVWSIEHSLRANRNFGKRLLFLADNLPLTLSVCKGRARSSFLTKPLRKICALALATGSRFHARWVPSEWNIADRPSRALTQWSSRGLKGWFSGDGHDLPRSRRTGPSTQSNGPCSDSAKSSDIRKDFKEENPSSGVNHSPSRDDLSRIKECESTHHSGLHTSISGVQQLAGSTSDPDAYISGTGQCDHRVPRGLVRGTQGHQRWNSGGCSHSILLASSSPRHSSNQQSIERLASGSPSTTEDANANRGVRSNDGVLADRRGAGSCTPSVHPVHDLHAAGRVQSAPSETAGETPRKPQPVVQLLGDTAAPDRGLGSRKNWNLRRLGHPRLRPLASPHPGGTHQIAKPTAAVVVDAPWKAARQVQQAHSAPQVGVSGTDLVCPEAWRSNPRCAFKAAVDAGGEAERKMVVRQFPQKICKGSPASDRISQSFKASKGIWPHDSSKPSHLHDQSIQGSAVPLSSLASESATKGLHTQWNSRITKRMVQHAVKPPKGPKSLSGAQVLRRLFKQISRKFRPHFHGVFLDIFSGDGSVGRYLDQLGYPVISIDVCDDPRFDVLDPQVQAVIHGWIKGGCVLGIWLATPCTTWSRARHGPIGSSWGPIRTNQFIYGLPGLSPKDVTKVRIGNLTMKFTAQTIRLAHSHLIPVFLENPVHSMIWLAPPLLRVCDFSNSRSFICDFCQYGARWRKRTRIQVWHGQDHFHLSRTCQGRHGFCSRTHKHHIVLKGQDPKTRQLWTHLAQPYPLKFAFVAAQSLVDAYEHMRSFQLKKWFGL